MSENFIATIKQYKEPLFYNSEGSVDAYKLCIRHLSAAMNAGLAKLSNGYIVPNDTLYLVDFEREEINLVSHKIKLINLKTLA